jgi:DNA-binding response OmpR family regulator
MLDKNVKHIRILFVEDDDIARENGVEYLENYFEQIFQARDALEALKLYEEHEPHIIITDIQMPKLNGLEFIKRIRQKDAQTQVIVLSAFSDTHYLLKAIELKLVKYLIKPVTQQALDEALSICLESLENNSSNIIHLDEDSIYDMFNQTLYANNAFIKLRTKELLLLQLLLKNKMRYVTYMEIENVVWEGLPMSKDALKTVVKNLKTKLPKNIISNLSGTGYKIDV